MPRKRTVLAEKQKNDIMSLYNKKVPQGQICKQIGIGIYVLRRFLVEQGKIDHSTAYKAKVKRGPRRYGDMTECKCPRCGKRHTLNFYYVGHLPARKYCHPCETFVSKYS